jgi:polyisoprenoid-binding protein YceI
MKRSCSGKVSGAAQRRLWLAALAVGALACVPAAGQAAPGFALKNGSRLWLDGTSTLHPYTSTANRLQVSFAQDTTRWPRPVSSLAEIEEVMRQGGVTALEVLVPVSGMRSGKSGLDRNMQKALQAEAHPAIRFRLGRYEVAPGATPEEFVVQARGWLAVAGVERPVELSVTARREARGIRLLGQKPLLMSEFEIRPPRMMMGAVRTADQVTVSFDLLIGSEGPPAPAARP